jgi:hypothetical protein
MLGFVATVQVQDIVSEALTVTTSCDYESLRRPIFADFPDIEPAKSSGPPSSICV